MNMNMSTTANSPVQNFESQLKELEEMGFTNREANLEALRRANGNIAEAIQYLCPDPND